MESVRLPLLAVWVCLVLIAAGPVLATEPPAEEPPAEEPVEEPPTLEAEGVTSITQAMQGESGISVQTMCTNCNSADLSLGGYSNEHVSIVCDGVPVPQGLAQIYLLSVIPPTVIDNVAVEKGAGRAGVGAGTVGGEIDLRRAALPETFRVNATVDTGEYGWSSARTDVSGQAGWFGGSLFATMSKSDVVDTDDDDNPDMAAIDRTTVEGRFDFELHAQHRVEVGAAYYDESQLDGRGNWDFLSTLIEGRNIWNHENVELDRTQYDARYTGRFADGSSVELSWLSADRTTVIDETQLIALTPGFETTYEIDQKQEHIGLNWSRPVGQRVLLRAGISRTEADYSIIDYRFNAERAFLPPDHAETEKTVEEGVWLESEITLDGGVDLFLGLRRARYEYTDTESNPFWTDVALPERSAWIPRGSLTWKPAHAFTFRFTAGNGRRQPPPTYEQVCCGRRYRNNRGIRMEESTAYGIEATYQPIPELRLNGSASRTTFSDLVLKMVTTSAQNQPVYQNVNIPEAVYQSYDLGGSFAPTSWLTVTSSVSKTRATNETENDEIPALIEFSFMPLEIVLTSADVPYVPEYTGSLGIQIKPFGGRATLDLSAQFSGQMTIQQYDPMTFDPITGGDSIYFVKTPSFWVGNLRALWDLPRGVQLFFGVDNFNDYYQEDIADPTTDYTWGPLRGRYLYGGLSFSLAR